MIDEMSKAYCVVGHWKVKLRRNQGFSQPENTSKIGRAILLMFTLGGFGDTASLYVAGAMIDPPSNYGTARSCFSVPRERL